MVTSTLAVVACLGTCVLAAYSTDLFNSSSLPAHYVYVDPRTVAVLGSATPPRQSSFATFFNPTNTTPPFFQIFGQEFLNFLGPSASIQVVAENDSFAFAHEAPVYSPATGEVFFASNAGGPLGMSDLEHNNHISKISLAEVERAVGSSGGGNVNVNVTVLQLADTVQMANGGSGPYKGSLLYVTCGRGELPPSVTLINPVPPYNSTVLLDNFFGRQFNSIDDVKIHPTSGNIFFTDVSYGYFLQFRPPPLMPNQVYRFDPNTASVRAVADGFMKPNGIAFTGDGETVYITDTGAAISLMELNQTYPTTIYAFDVDKTSQAFTNRRVFAYVDTGIPDGIQVDKAGNVYASCGDGVQVWNSKGTLLGKFFLGSTSANMVFAGAGRFVILAETRIYLAKIAAVGPDLEFP